MHGVDVRSGRWLPPPSGMDRIARETEQPRLAEISTRREPSSRSGICAAPTSSTRCCRLPHAEHYRLAAASAPLPRHRLVAVDSHTVALTSASALRELSPARARRLLNTASRSPSQPSPRGFRHRESRLRYASAISRRNASDPEVRATAHGTQLRIRGVAESDPYVPGSDRSTARPAQPTPPPVAPRRPADPVPRVTLTIAEAASALGISESSFRALVLPDLRVVCAGPRLKLVRVAELDRWAQRLEAILSQ